MAKENPEKDVRDDEIDLLGLFRRIGRTISGWLKATGKGILICIIFLFRKWIPLTISLIAGILLSFLMKISFPPSYSSDMIIRSNAMTNSEMITYINRLHSFCLGRNVTAVSEALSIPADKGKSIKDIEAFWVIDRMNDGIPDYVDYKNKFNVYDSVNLRMQDRLVIRARYSNPQYLNLLRDGIFSYTENNSLFREKNSLRLLQLNEMLTRLSYDIKQLDSLQKVKYFEETRNRLPDKNGQMIFLQEQNTQLIYEDIYKLYSRKQSLDQEKDLYPGVISLISDFTIPVKSYTGLIYYGKVVVPIIVGLTLIILILLGNRKRIKDLFKRY